MSDEQPPVRTADSYSPTNLTESYHPQGYSEAPAVVPQMVSGVLSPASPAPTPVEKTVAFVPQNGGE
jgi:hypothetical protein